MREISGRSKYEAGVIMEGGGSGGLANCSLSLTSRPFVYLSLQRKEGLARKIAKDSLSNRNAIDYENSQRRSPCMNVSTMIKITDRKGSMS